jgi:hypothetical protein
MDTTSTTEKNRLKQKYETSYGADKIKSIISKYVNDKKSSRTIAAETGISNTQIRRILAANDIEGKSIKTNDDLEKQIIDMYINGKSFEQIARELGNIDATTAGRIIKRNNIEKRTHSESRQEYDINNNFFTNIDSEENAYFLGFLYADGNVDKDGNSITICLHQRDIDVLEKFMNFLYNGEKPKLRIDREIYRAFTITNKQMREDLIKHGCVPNKTFNIRMPTTFDDPVLIKHFIRGLYDGDGCITIGKDNDNRIRTVLTGFIDMLSGVKDLLKKELSIEAHLYKEKRGSEGIFNLFISDLEGSYKFIKWLYSDATVYMERKYQKHLEALKIFDEKMTVRSYNKLQTDDYSI